MADGRCVIDENLPDPRNIQLLDPTKQFEQNYLISRLKSKDARLKEIYEDTVYNPENISVCIGSAIVDIEVLPLEETKKFPKSEVSYFPAEIKQRAGGVARNHAEALSRLGIDVDLISAFGIDENGNTDIGATFLFKKLEGLKNLIDTKAELISVADYVLIDANFPSAAIERVFYWANRADTKIWLDPTDALKVPNIFNALGERPLKNVDIFSPNLSELRSFSEYLSQKVGGSEAIECSRFVSEIEENLINSSKINSLLLKLPFALQPRKHLIITLDRFGVLIFSRMINDEFSVEFLEAPNLRTDEISSVSGAGDCFNSGFLSATLSNFNLNKCIQVGNKCAELSLLSVETVPETLNKELLNN
uniref:PfkB domain-containing protein n=1 Tax=Meloidogyne hapla TaxID=6305 RepID=A0A1I8C2W7_MELHA